MDSRLPLFWYLEPPIDFEHKQYVLWSYLQQVDISFLNKKVSPWLLHLEKLEEEMCGFTHSLTQKRLEFDRNRYIWFPNPKLEGEHLELIEIIEAIVGYSQPQIHSRIETGRVILKRYHQVLF